MKHNRILTLPLSHWLTASARLACGIRAWRACALMLVCALLGAGGTALAAPLSGIHPPPGPLGLHAGIMVESGPRLTPLAVLDGFRHGAMSPGTRPVLSFGIGARPVWLHWRIENPGSETVTRQLTMATPWIDSLDIYLLQQDTLLAHWKTGDAQPYLNRPVPGLGFSFRLELRPGINDVLLRAETTDPMVLPVLLQSEQAAANTTRHNHYNHGLIYGYLLALIAYNLLLYAGLRKRSHLLYAIYLTAFIAMNLAYTGHGFAWYWPEHPGVQRFIILVLMVVFGVAGLQFAARFLDLARHAPKGLLAVHVYSIAGLAAVLIAAITQAQEAAAWIAFGFVVSFATTVLALGAFAVRKRYPAGAFFLAAAVCGMSGTLVSAFAVWGLIPYNTWTFRAIEFGMLADATLLALALAHRFRRDQMDRLRAEHLARTDALTGLHNRLAFHEQAEAIWSTAVRNDRHISVVMFDIDHFKQLNDAHGHARGDQALAEVGRLLRAVARRGDVEARWGGEEFILLLPETDLAQATVLAERLRRQITLIRLRAPSGEITITASFGVAQRSAETSLEALIDEADAMLYRAKQQGRNRVVGQAQPSDTPPAAAGT